MFAKEELDALNMFVKQAAIEDKKIQGIPTKKPAGGLYGQDKEKTMDKDINSSTKIMETIMAVVFVSLDNNINYPMACRKTDIFKNIEKKLYLEFPILKSKKIYFVANGNIVNSSYTIEQNKIENGNTILIYENESIY